MKTLNNHIILYDAECPMCKLYTNQFIKRGMLDADGRAPYQTMPETVCPYVDKQRAVNEIALVNTQTGEVEYGVKSLFKVIAHSFPVFEPLFTLKPFIWLMSRAYGLVSYNRRVIAPSAADQHRSIDPTFSLKHRIAYLLFTCFAVGFVLTHYAVLLTDFVPAGNPYREYLICGGQVIFQGIIISLYAPKKRWDYLGNMMTISLAGALLLVPVILLHNLIYWQLFFPLYFMLVAGLMFAEHIRRTKLLNLGWLLSITWVLYRIVLLLIILNLI
jgi:predicted DCC family thiol-disulfide oxidoreductase YuxK